jgi:hypothetical protein
LKKLPWDFQKTVERGRLLKIVKAQEEEKIGDFSLDECNSNIDCVN